MTPVASPSARMARGSRVLRVWDEPSDRRARVRRDAHHRRYSSPRSPIGLRSPWSRRNRSARLAIIVLALGICGVTTMFSVVNGVMLRGFSFPNADRLASAELHRPDERDRLRLQRPDLRDGLRGVRPLQQSFEKMAAYLNGSTVNVTIDGHPQRYTGAYVTDDFLRDPRRDADDRPRFHAGRQHAGRRESRDHRLRHLAARLRRRVRHRRQDRPASTASRRTIIGVMPQGFAFPANEELWIPLYSEFPPRPRNDPRGEQPGGARPARSPASRSTRPTRSSPTIAQRFAAAYPGHQQAVQHRRRSSR